MVGAMTLKLAQDASLEEMVRRVAAQAALLRSIKVRVCVLVDDTQKIYAYLSAH